MRTLSADLLAAQRSASAEPRVSVVVENSIGGARRLDFTQLDATSQPIAKHDAAVAGDGSLTRVRIEAGAVKQQRVADPSAGPWTSWATLVSGVAAQVACAARGARVAVVYCDAAGAGVKLRESTDNGASFGAEQAVATAAATVVDLAAAYKNSAGDLAIGWATATSVNLVRRISGAFGSVATTSPAVSSFSGVALAYGADWDFALTGVEAATLKPSLWTAAYGDGNDVAAGTWSSLAPQQQAESDAQVTYRAPSLVYTDAYRIDFVEADVFAGGSTRVWRTMLHNALTFVAGAFTFRSPAPVNYGGIEGLALAADAGGAGYVYECAPDAVYRASQSQVLATVTADVRAAEVEELPFATRGFLELDNSGVAYAGPPAPIAVGNLVAVSWGYRTASGVQTSRMADLWVAATEYRRTGGVSVLRLYVEGGWEMLRRSRQRAQVVHTSDTYFTVLLRLFSRAGLLLTSSSGSNRLSTVTPKFTVHPDTSALESVRRALAFVADRVRMRPSASGSITEPLATAASDYTYGTAHPLRSVGLRGEPPAVSEVQSFGAGVFGEALDFANAAAWLGTRALQRDATSGSAAAAGTTAAAQLRQRALDTPAGRIVVPPNCGQEVLDVVDFSDPLIAPSPVRRRVAGISWLFDREHGRFEQRIALGAL